MLYIFDLNGCLVYREYIPKNKKVKGLMVGRHRVIVRPFAGEVMKWLWSQGHQVAIWTSMIKRNAVPIIELIFGSSRSILAFEWYHEECVVFTGVGEEKGKPLMIKPLKKVREIFPNFGCEMVMVDDSEEKLLANPPESNLVVKEFLGDLKDQEMLKLKNERVIKIGLPDYSKLFSRILAKTVPKSQKIIKDPKTPEERAVDIIAFGFPDTRILVNISEIIEDQDKFLISVFEVGERINSRSTGKVLNFLGNIQS